jgi:hypothetical protein
MLFLVPKPPTENFNAKKWFLLIVAGNFEPYERELQPKTVSVLQSDTICIDPKNNYGICCRNECARAVCFMDISCFMLM